MAEIAVQFAKIVELDGEFGLEAAPDFPLENRVADTQEALLGRLFLDMARNSKDAVIDIETTDHVHITVTKKQGETLAPAA